MEGLMGRIGRSFQLVGQSYRVLMQDKELMFLPLLSAGLIAGVIASFFFAFGLSLGDARVRHPSSYVPLFLMYVAAYTISIFFQAAVVAGATDRLNGGDPTVRSALAAAGRRFSSILMWAVIAATVGLILRVIQERVGFLGKIIAGLLGAAWSLATFFVVPVLVLEDHSIGDSFTRSVSVFRETWGESVVGSVNIGLAAFLSWITLVAIVGLLAWMQSAISALVVGIVGAIGLLTFFSALQGIFIASLYRFATHGHDVEGFDSDLLTHAFVPKKR
jgi:hypothetical protein